MLPHEQIENEVTSAATLDEAAASLDLLLSSGLSVWQDGTLYYTKQVNTPPAKPGALGCEPLKAAGRGR
jgi:hypothetical protein